MSTKQQGNKSNMLKRHKKDACKKKTLTKQPQMKDTNKAAARRLYQQINHERHMLARQLQKEEVNKAIFFQICKSW